MVYKLGHTKDIDSIPFKAGGRLLDNLFEFLNVLDNEYGTDRDIDRDDGGYVLFCTLDTSEAEVRELFNYPNHTPEWVEQIDHQPTYCAALFILKEDYAVVLVSPLGTIFGVTTASRAEQTPV